MEFRPQAFEDLFWWVEKDRKTALKIGKLLREIERSPFEGTGKPEPLRYSAARLWSRRIDGEHRIVYEVTSAGVIVHACRFHYDDME